MLHGLRQWIQQPVRQVNINVVGGRFVESVQARTCFVKSDAQVGSAIAGSADIGRSAPLDIVLDKSIVEQ